MENIVSKLKEIQARDPSNASVNNTLTHLSHSREISWDILVHDFQLLEEQGLWERTPENSELLTSLQHSFHDSTSDPVASTYPDMSAVKAPSSIAPHPLLRSIPPNTILPIELLELLNDVYFLHLLANDPAKVLSPGKSLLSVMSKPRTREEPGDLPSIQEKVEEVIHKAFWEEALDSLSSAQPPVQLPRLKLLYNDLHAALTPLLPAEHVVLVTLSAPLSPTSAPLLSALSHLREVLVALQGRCAPVRDAEIKILMHRLDDPPPASMTAELATLVVETVRSILKLAEVMKDDLSEFVLGTMGEDQLRVAIREQARARERGLALELWKKEKIESQWNAWVEELTSPLSSVAAPPQRKWVLRLIQALGAAAPVACPLPVKPVPSDEEPGTEATPVLSNPNTLPPPFFFSAPELFHIQNLLQGLVIAAALRALLPSASSPVASDFVLRIWTLLLASINDEPDSLDIKLVNFADELIRALGGSIDPDEETRLRAAVDRTLKLEDPVFILLQRRLMVAIAGRLVAPPAPVRRDVPGKMSTGRERPGKRPRLEMPSSEEVKEEETEKFEGLEVKGFEDPVLLDGIKDAMKTVRTAMRWIESTWAGFVEVAEVRT